MGPQPTVTNGPAAQALVCPLCRDVPPAPDNTDASDTGGAASLPNLPCCPKHRLALVTREALSTADGDPFLGTTVDDRFTILARLGAGSMGTVYRARQAAMGRDVAVKILRSDRTFDANARGRFTREARAMSLLTSPHTVTVFDFGEIPDPGSAFSPDGSVSLYLAMELMKGESLGERLKRVRRLNYEDAARFVRHALRSLSEAHAKGIVHRDLKPDNLFLVKPPTEVHDTCKVLDFGIAKLLGENLPTGVDALETQAGTVFGTPRYMSPEQAQGKPLDARSDLYSLGVIFYQMLTGKAPFTDDDAVVVMAHHIKTVPAPPHLATPDANIPTPISVFVLRALAKEPGARPPSAKAFMRELDDAMNLARKEAVATGDMPAVIQEPPSQGTGLRKTWRRSAGRIVAVLAFGTIGAGLFVFGAKRPPLSLAARGIQQALGVTFRVAAKSARESTGETALPPTAASPAAPAATAQPAPTWPRPTPRPVAPPPKNPARNPYTRFE